MKKIFTYLIVLGLVSLLASCGVSYKDGTYTGFSEDEENGSSMEVEITIKDGEIYACTMVAYDDQGNVKDENYGKSAGDALYKKAQRAVKGMAEYPNMLVEAGNPNDVDAVAGATVSGKQFKLAVKNALEQAEE